MWEIFSLGDIPYANILLKDSQLRKWLENGNRLPVTAIGWSSVEPHENAFFPRLLGA
jgi:hypothetical protein